METLKKGSKNQDAVLLLQTLLHEAGVLDVVDGIFGPATDRAVKSFQALKGLVVDGIAGEKTWTCLFLSSQISLQRSASRFLEEHDLCTAAEAYHLELAVIKAVNEVESTGSGFVADKPKILFEGHVFWRELVAKGMDPTAFRQGNEDILYPAWTKKFYRGGPAEHERLRRAVLIDREAALRSASWGAFQIMGVNAESMGYRDVVDFTERMAVHEREHLEAFCRFIDVNRLVRALREKDWRTFARGYNGPGYEKNRYHIRLQQAYRRYC
ncbi:MULTISPECIES: N-acetylmuramidase domain-containing protein [Prosthecochloris]|uniref:DUF3380 domain-containing protein n=1 Tax=Prosthecochloris vibrioformis TaxID=1098 RepID=A0A5C4S388_PROVB|nr:MULTISPECIES: N-acetylmuramidase family protein [Prosthecochloris]ANT65691.1 spore cortex-lytic enzyme [Prosthecochloris sp. CIB 2401]TNJ37933.1 DUF3380 domain-containing protein [Prosthecochloris vibrioformis]